MTELEKQNGLLKVAIIALNRAGLTGKELNDNGLLIEPFRVREEDKKKQIQQVGYICLLVGVLSFTSKFVFGSDINLGIALFFSILFSLVLFSIFYFSMNSLWKKRIKLSKEVRISNKEVQIIKYGKTPIVIPFEKVSEIIGKIEKTPELAGVVKIITKGMGVHEIAKMHSVAHSIKPSLIPGGSRRHLQKDIEQDALKVKAYLDSKILSY